MTFLANCSRGSYAENGGGQARLQGGQGIAQGGFEPTTEQLADDGVGVEERYEISYGCMRLIRLHY